MEVQSPLASQTTRQSGRARLGRILAVTLAHDEHVVVRQWSLQLAGDPPRRLQPSVYLVRCRQHHRHRLEVDGALGCRPATPEATAGCRHAHCVEGEPGGSGARIGRTARIGHRCLGSLPHAVEEARARSTSRVRGRTLRKQKVAQTGPCEDLPVAHVFIESAKAAPHLHCLG